MATRCLVSCGVYKVTEACKCCHRYDDICIALPRSGDLLEDPIFSIEERLRTIHQAWENSAVDSPIRKIIVHQLIHSIHSYDYDYEGMYTDEGMVGLDIGTKLKVSAGFF